MIKETSSRRYDIDWLRNFAILLLFPFHASRIFDIWEPFYVKSPELSNGLSWFIVVTSLWFMPLLFMLAGAASYFALKKRTPGQYIKERVNKLLIPFLFGLAVIVPPQAYIALSGQAGYSADYWTFLKGYFTNFSDLSGYFGTFTPAHLWFILFLFVISMAILPFMVWSRNRKPWEALSNPWVLLLFFIPLTLSEALPNIGGKNPFFFLFLFFIGFMIMKDDGITETLDRIKFKCLLGVVLFYPIWIFLYSKYQNAGDFSTAQILIAFLRNLGLLLVLFVLLGYSRKYLNRSSPLLKYMNQAAFPVYILHQTVMMFAGFYVIKLNIPLYLKFIVIMVLALALSVGLYEVIRRIPGLRWLFGIKPSGELKKAVSGGQSG